MTFFEIIADIFTVLFLAAAVYYGRKEYKKYKAKKKAKEEKQKPVGVKAKGCGGKLDFRADQSLLKHANAGMEKIKQGNPDHYSVICATAHTIILRPGYRIVDGEPNKNILGAAKHGGDTIKLYQGALIDYMKQYPAPDLFAKVITHEYLHLIGYEHGEKMTFRQTALIESFDGKVDWPTS